MTTLTTRAPAGEALALADPGIASRQTNASATQ